MAATAADYAWFEDRFPDLAGAYCLTLVRGLTPAQVLARLGARTDGPHVRGVERLPDLALDPAAEQLIGVTAVEAGEAGWALAVERGGRLGVTEEATVPLSAGTRLVSHLAGPGGAGHFCWVEDGDVRAAFEPPFHSHRGGGAHDEQAEVMRADAIPAEAIREAGFDLGAQGTGAEFSTGAAFALAERLSGVRVTPGLLQDSSFLCGVAPHP